MKLFIDQTKPGLGNMEHNLKLMVESVEKAIEEKQELIVFPELALTGKRLEDITFDVAIENVPEILLEKSCCIDIIFGAVEQGDKCYPCNTAYYLSGGKVIGKHRKVYLSDYGAECESRCFMRGNGFESFDTKFGKVEILTGDEIYHQSAQYILAAQGIKYLFVLTNESANVTDCVEKIGKNIKLAAGANSLLNGVFTVVANRTGVEDGFTFYGNSFVMSPSGEMVAQGEYFKPSPLRCVLEDGELRRAAIRHPFFKNEDTALTVEKLQSIRKNIK